MFFYNLFRYNIVFCRMQRIQSLNANYYLIFNITSETSLLIKTSIQLKKYFTFFIFIFYRLILTGTPIQNNLIEFWALVNWATSGNMLGTKANFKAQYVDPILAGQEPKVILFFIPLFLFLDHNYLVSLVMNCI